MAYKLDGSNATQNYYAMLFLTRNIPTARFTQGMEPDKIIAWAQPKVHEEIAELIELIQGGEENAPKPVIYNLRNTTAATATVMLRRMVPSAIASTGTDPYELVVWARGRRSRKDPETGRRTLRARAAGNGTCARQLYGRGNHGNCRDDVASFDCPPGATLCRSRPVPVRRSGPPRRSRTHQGNTRQNRHRRS